MEKAKVEYPCWWTYAIIGPDEEGLRLAVGSITRGEKHKVDFSKESAHKKYVSLHVDIWVDTEEKRDTLFQAFKNHPAVKVVL